MILHRLEVEGFRCFREAIALEALDLRLNLVVGPNESGKSSLFLALHHAFFTPYGAAGLELERCRPWGTDLSPRVCVEFENGGIRYRLEKGFLDRAGCRISEWTGAKFEAVADGDRADERVRAVLLGERPGKGPARSEHRGLARLLWVPQGDHGGPALALAQPVRTKIQSALGRITVDPGEATLIERSEAAYNEIFTPARGDYKKGSDVQRLGEDVGRLSSGLEEIRARHREAEHYGNTLEGLEADRTRLAQERRRLQEERESLREEIEALLELRRALEVARADLKARESEFQRLDQDRRTVASAKETLATQSVAGRKAAEELEAIVTRQAGLEGEEKQLQGEVGRVRAEIDRLEAERQRALKLKSARDSLENALRIGGAVSEAQEVTKVRSERTRVLDGLKRPTHEDVVAARQRIDRLRELEGALRNVGLTVTVRLEEARRVEFEGPAGRVEARLEPGEEQQFSAADRALLRILGVGAVEVRSGAREIRTIQADLEQDRKQLIEHLQRFGVNNVDELEALKNRCDMLRQEIAGLDAQVRALAGEWKTLDGLKQAHAGFLSKAEALSRELGMALEGIRQVALPDIEAIEAALRKAVDEVRSVEAQRDGANKAAREAERQRSEALKDKSGAEATAQAARQAIDETLRAFGEEAALERAYQEARRERDAARERVRDLEAKLPPPDRDPERRAASLAQDEQRVQTELDKVEEQVIGLRTLIERAAAEGLYGKLAKEEEALVAARARYDRAEGEARATKLLRDLIDGRRRAITSALTRPVEERVTSLFGRVTSREKRRISFNDHLEPAAFSVERADGLPLEDLSGGAREQLALVTRLALAQYLAQDERMLFVLDDTLVQSDPDRHERFLAILKEAAESLQVVLLTCHPERYQGLKAAKIFSLV